jgi:hypothetical protein
MKRSKAKLTVSVEEWMRYMADDGYFTVIKAQLKSMPIAVKLHAATKGAQKRVACVAADQLLRQLAALRTELNGLDLDSDPVWASDS